MDLMIIDNQKTKLVNELNKLIDDSNKIRIAVAFAKKSGFLKIQDSLKKFLHRQGKAEFIIGLDFHTTDPETLKELKNLSDTSNLLNLFCYRGNMENTAAYHPKLYIFQDDTNQGTYIIGSSNLTSGGLINNIEVNVKVRSDIIEESFSDVLSIFYLMLTSKNKIIPNDMYIERYEEVYDLSRKGKDYYNTKAFKEITDLEKDLPKLQIQKGELIGWMRLVYDYLPSGKFGTSEVYKFEDIFREKYPENKNIKAKIRQQLQFLRDIGLIKNPARNTWLK